ncbi:hypothetical protein CTAYLR_000310 [Chrysophaeum taylorii]|uniref:Peptidyl-prolyl cis-trans isomerase n=1 Tax=Chrysophaeum taylorii TaxID=2483200 RepID=A0AAD7UH32_9STRA|nr:hypothetical protein CTAYLR_000310 [Chrysophaeum taylorii]
MLLAVLRRTLVVVPRRCGRDSGRGWWQKYQREGPAGFTRYNAPKSFDFDAADGATKARRSRCFFELSVDGEGAGVVEFELADEILPVTCANFRLLCSGEAPSGFDYGGSKFARRVVKHVAIMGGNVETPGGSHSAFASRRYFPDEGFLIPHSAPGILTMANSGRDTNGSQFYVTLASAPHMDGRCVAFGRVTSGFDTILKIHDTVFTQRGKPVQTVLVANCGVLPSKSPSSSNAALSPRTSPPQPHALSP